MQQVMRFDYETDGFGDYLGMCMSDDGDYVYYDDYKTLAATVIEQQAEIERLRDLLVRLFERHSGAIEEPLYTDIVMETDQ